MKKENVSDVYLYNYLIYKSEKKMNVFLFLKRRIIFFFSLGRGTVFIFWSLPEGVKL